ncbi:DUF4097 family beta strand repeat-containing protein [Sphaerisporangium sp. TRM90804]|uniref:DUF4097 family beta strand repeat-containing protein n=1 Tax=Sphaerisporangium sp. TRM90804 TaxID=3031113 RepID=UPI00244AB0E5|nr:DUF4097 family beta strand repeat-containing protein [Sphaerisporangium sp. TRM90804]MDH2425308.1 DUF4097 family beta strand repeat-containing protein [Sphaerisporangium sp. TRM90804]
MPTFDTPEPILATLDLTAADVRIHASDRADTVVEIHPMDESSDTDVRSAAETQVEYAQGRLLVRTPKPTGRSWFRWGGSTRVHVELPAGSRVDARTTGDFRCEGRLGESRFDTADGDIWLDHVGKLRSNTGDGDITVMSAGHADITTGNGGIRIGEIDGAAVIKTAHGDIALGEATGDLRLRTAHGDITVVRALAGVHATTATGDVRVGEVVRGSHVLETASGEVEAGIRQGTAAYLDVRTDYGRVRVSLEPCDAPGRSGETAEVRARTSDGDIVIRRG